MNPSTLETSARFLRAAASYFGVPPDQLILGGQAGTIGGVFSVQLTIALTPDDLVGIVKRMSTMEEKPSIKGLSIGHRAGMSKAQSDQFDAEGLTGMWRGGMDGAGAADMVAIESSEGAGGRKVVHVADAPEELQDADSALPAAVWVNPADLSAQQRAMASDVDESQYCLMQVDMLTAEQKLKYGVAS